MLAVGLHTCTAVARSLCVSWAFLYLSLNNSSFILSLAIFVFVVENHTAARSQILRLCITVQAQRGTSISTRAYTHRWVVLTDSKQITDLATTDCFHTHRVAQYKKPLFLSSNHRRTGHGSFGGGGQDQICPNFRQSPLRPRSSGARIEAPKALRG